MPHRHRRAPVRPKRLGGVQSERSKCVALCTTQYVEGGSRRPAQGRNIYRIRFKFSVLANKIPCYLAKIPCSVA
jgi:hypothetical protein